MRAKVYTVSPPGRCLKDPRCAQMPTDGNIYMQNYALYFCTSCCLFYLLYAKWHVKATPHLFHTSSEELEFFTPDYNKSTPVRMLHGHFPANSSWRVKPVDQGNCCVSVLAPADCECGLAFCRIVCVAATVGQKGRYALRSTSHG